MFWSCLLYTSVFNINKGYADFKEIQILKQNDEYALIKSNTTYGLSAYDYIGAEAMEKNLPYELKCPSLLICGTQDHAGSCIRYNKAWHQKSKISLKWLEGAGSNSNTDKP